MKAPRTHQPRAIRICLLIGAATLAVVGLLTLGSIKVSTSRSEQALIDSFLQAGGINKDTSLIHAHFANEFQFIRRMQLLVLGTVKAGDIGTAHYGSLKYYLTKREGLCYDRAVFMEKVLAGAGFRFRHAFIFLGSSTDKPAITDYIRRMSPTHAALEVRTKKGWIAVDTNTDWIGLDSTGEVLSLKQVRKRIRHQQFNLSGLSENNFLRIAPHFTVLYGLYSRNGQFFAQTESGKNNLVKRLIPALPDYDLQMVLENI